MSINRILLAGASGATGSDVRNYSLYEYVDASNIFLRYGTIDVTTGGAVEGGAHNVATPLTGYTTRQDSCRHNGYIGYQSRYGFFIFNESDGSEVGSKKNSSYITQNTGLSMCVVDDFIVGIEPYNTNNFRVWKFNTTDETFTTVYSGYAPSLRVYGVSNFNSGNFALCYINSSNYDQIDTFNISTNTRTSLYSGSYAFSGSYPHSVVLAPLNDTEYVIGVRTSIFSYLLRSYDYATNTAQNTASLTAAVGSAAKLGYANKLIRGNNSAYLAFCLNNFTATSMTSLLQRDASTSVFRAFEGAVGSTGAFAYSSSNRYPDLNTGSSHLFDNIFVNSSGTIYDAATLETLGTMPTSSATPQSIFIS